MYLSTGSQALFSMVLFGASAFLYVASDSAAINLFLLTSDYQTSRIFITIRELAALLFILSIPYILKELVVLKDNLIKINQFLIITGIIVSASVLIITLYDTSLLIGSPGEIYNNYRLICAIKDLTPLFIFKNLVLIFYMVYAVVVILYSIFLNRIVFPVLKIFISLIILSYFILSGFFYILFFNNNSDYISFSVPYLSTGIAIVLLLNTFSLIDILVDYAKKLVKIENNLNRIVYEDRYLKIPNRNGFVDDLQVELFNGSNLTLFFIDIDDFQNINESFGEKSGDEILKLFSERMLNLFSSEGKLYRIGGDDFVFIIKRRLSDEEAGKVAEQIISSLRNPFKVYGVSHMLTVCIGIFQVPRDGGSVNSIISSAYSVIRSAKQTKNSYRFFSKEMAESSSRKIGIVNILRTSINLDQFQILYQPVVNIKGELIYAEALLRCTNPDPSIAGPGQFIPLMEKAGLIKEIDNMVIRKAFHDMELRIKKRFGISINLSSNQLVDPSYSDFLYAFAGQHGIDPGEITLEVIENTLIENLESGRNSIQKFKDKGFKIAIDDFGKGFSSLSYISELPVDILKIDMVFVQSIPGDPKKEAVATHIMNLAHSLNIKVVAEGFEAKDQVDFFKNLGCDNFQGYYFSQPLPLDELLKKYFP